MADAIDDKTTFINFETLLDRAEIKGALQNLVKKELNLTVLLVGEKGLGKYSLARAFSEILLCNTPKQSETNDFRLACHDCASCRYLQAQTHPDYQELRRNNTAKQLTMEEIRNFIDTETHLQPVLASRRVFIIDMDAISLAGQNLLLKTLESGANSNFYLLLANSQTSVLPTIRSRSLIYLLPHLSQTDMQNLWSSLEPTLTAKKSDKELLAFAQGNPGFLKQLLADENFLTAYANLLELFNHLLAADLAVLLSDIYTALTEYKDKQKFVYLQQIWTFFFYQKSINDQRYVRVFQAWEKCMRRLQANGSFELQLQSFLIDFSSML